MPINPVISITINSVAENVSFVDRYANKASFALDTNSFTEKHTVTADRVLPVRRGKFFGHLATSLRVNEDRDVAAVDGTTVKNPVVFRLTGSIPAGVARSVAEDTLERLIALANTTEGRKMLLDGDITVV